MVKCNKIKYKTKINKLNLLLKIKNRLVNFMLIKNKFSKLVIKLMKIQKYLVNTQPCKLINLIY